MMFFAIGLVFRKRAQAVITDYLTVVFSWIQQPT